MDFDDLDEEVERRVNAGETVVGHVAENKQPRQGTVLPLAAAKPGLASHHKLPPKQRSSVAPYNGEKVVERKPVLRLLCVHGVADSYAQDWYTLAEEAPADLEVLVHEFPGHGHREGETMLNTLEAFASDAFEAFREAMDTGAFALLGHSIGCLIITAVAKRAREELGVEPVQVFMVERGAPPFNLLTEAGMDMLKNDRESLMAIWNPLVLEMSKKGGALGARTMDAWCEGLPVENDTLEVGWHVFRCPLLVLYADSTVGPWLDIEKVEDEGQRSFLQRKKVIHQMFQLVEDGKTFTGHFALFTYHEWDKWTEHSRFQVLKCDNCDHMTIKSNLRFRTAIWSALREQIDLF